MLGLIMSLNQQALSAKRQAFYMMKAKMVELLA